MTEIEQPDHSTATVETDQTEQGDEMSEDRIATLTRQAEELYDHTWNRLQAMRAERQEREEREAAEQEDDDTPEPITH